MKVNTKYIFLGILLMVIMLVFCIICICVLADENNNISTQEDVGSYTKENYNSTTICSDVGSDYDFAYIDLQEERFLRDQSFVVPIIVNSQKSIRRYDYSQVGFEIISITIINPTQINLELSCLPNAIECFLSLDIELNSNCILKVPLYAISNETGIYISQYAKDDAFDKYLNFAVSSGILTDNDSKRLRMEHYKNVIVENSFEIDANSKRDLPFSITNQSMLLNNTTSYTQIPQTRSSTNTYITGKLEWIADDGIVHPLRRVKVKIFDYDSAVLSQTLGTVFTDNEGNYSFAFENKDSALDLENGGYDLFIKVYAGDDNVMVVKANGEEYYYQSDEKAHMNVATGSTTVINMRINMSYVLGRAFQISQSLITARDFAWNMKGSIPSNVTLRYPYDNGCYYNITNKQITITGNSPVTGNPNSYASWDVIMHEYGHHIQHDMGISESPAGWHTFTDNMADHYAGTDSERCESKCARHRSESPISASEAKLYGTRIAYAEAWASCFGAIAQKYYENYLSGIQNTNNNEYNSYNGAYINFETANASNDLTKTWTITKGDACEGSVLSLLWDIYDSGTETNDKVSLGYRSWWNLTTNNGDKDLFSLIQYFYSTYPQQVDDIGENLSFFEMAPTKVNSFSETTALTTKAPLFAWDSQGGSTNFHNNSFELLIYNHDFTLLLNIPTSTKSITLNTSWDTVLSWPGEDIYVAVKGYQTSQTVTGGYVSEYRKYTKPIFKTSSTNDGIIITGTYSPLVGTIEIPSIINEQTVIGIGAQAFSNQSELTSITLPSTIASIGNRAFQFCNNLSYVDMHSTSVTRIEEYTFDTCAITSISLPSVITYIGEGAFIRAGKLTGIPNSVTYIGDYAYAYTNSLSLVILNNVGYIGNNAFIGCDSLTLYTVEQSKPSTWNENWNSSNRPVVWGCNATLGYVVSLTKTENNPTNINAINGIKNPYRPGYSFGGWYISADFSGTQYMDLSIAPTGLLYVKWEKNSCLSEGSLITLADGTQKAVEDLTGDEQLLVWNMITGQFDTASILFIDSDPRQMFEVINLYFSDGTSVEVISEHAFWDFDLNRYVFIRNDAEQYVGHHFNKQSYNEEGNMIWTRVELLDVEITKKITTAWSPVTYGHLCYYVNGMLSMPGATEALINIFEVDPDAMKYDEQAMNQDIATYGLFTYEEFNALIPVPEEIFEAFNGQYLKVSIGKGYTSIEELAQLIERYSQFF